MILTGQPIDAAKAEAWGLVSEVVAEGALLARARELAAQIGANAPLGPGREASGRRGLAGHARGDPRVSRRGGGATEDAKEGARRPRAPPAALLRALRAAAARTALPSGRGQ